MKKDSESKKQCKMRKEEPLLWMKTNTSSSKSRIATGSAGSKAQEERDGGRLSAGREMPVIADGDGEQEREVWVHSAGRKVRTAVA